MTTSCGGTGPAQGAGWVVADDLRPGDQLEWHRSESWGAGEISTREIAEAALAGWLQSDGFVGQYDRARTVRSRSRR